MAIQNYLSIDYTVSPRLIIIDTTLSTSISVQDLIDTCSNIGANSANIDDAILLESSGKEYLTADGSVKVGLTVTLNNCRIKFTSPGSAPWILCSIEGGNVVAVEDIYTSPRVYIDVVEPSEYVTVERVSSSSATLSELSAIQYSSFGGAVAIDVVDGVAGTTYNIGTVENPVNNIPDALLIADSRGFERFHIHGDLTLGAGDNVDGFEFVGHSPSKTTITIEDAASTVGCEFKECTVSGILDGNAVLENCVVDDLNYIEGRIENCTLIGVIVLSGSEPTRIYNCFDGTPGYANNPVIDCGGSGRGLSVGNFTGGIDIINKTGPEILDINLITGTVTVADTVTSGTIYCRGIGQVIDSSGDGCTVVNEMLYITDIKSLLTSIKEVYDGDVIIDTVSGTVGTAFPIGTRKVPSSNLTDALTICDNNNIKRLRLRSDLTIEAGHNISNMSVETRGIMGTDVTLESGCGADNTAFRYVNLQGTVNNSDTLLVENCSILNLSNFTGIMQGVSFAQGSEISIGTWAEIYNCRAGGEAGNEPEISIGNGLLNIQQYRGNLKLTDKTGTDRTVASFLPGNVTIADTCVSGTIQILGIGEVEKDDSGPNCKVDVDAAITNEYIADHVLDELVTEHSVENSLGLSIQKTLGLLHQNIYIDETLYDTDDNLISGRVRIYSSSASVGTDENVIGTFTITAEGDGAGKIIYFKQVEI